MKFHIRALLTSIGSALIATTSAEAAYQGLTVLSAGNHVVNGVNTTSWRVYAVFSDPGDFLTSVAGTPTLGNLVIQSCSSAGFFPGGNFVNVAGGTTAPSQSLIDSLPSAEWDTFCTIGVAIDDGTDATSLSPSFPVFISGTQLISNNIGWFTAGPVPQGMAGNGINLGGGNWGVLMMQLTVNAGNHVRGTVAVGGVHNTGIPGGTTFQTNADQVFYCIPTPGILAIFTLAYLGGARSRRTIG